MLYSPTNLFPSALGGMNTIDAAEQNKFSAQVNGDTQVGKYRLVIYKNDALSTLVYDTGVVALAAPVYPVNYLGENERITVLVPANSGMANGNEYKYTVEVFGGSSSAKTTEELFVAARRPQLLLSVPNTVVMKSHHFSAVYQQQQGIPLKHFSWTLRNLTTHRLVRETGDIYSQDVRFSYDGFLSHHRYGIRLTAATQSNIALDTGEIEFDVEYMVTPVSSFVGVEGAEGLSALKVAWNPVLINGETDMASLAYLPNTPKSPFTSLRIPRGRRVWFNKVNMAPMHISSYVSHVVRASVWPTTPKNVVYRADGTLYGNPYFVEVFVQYYSLYVNINDGQVLFLCHLSSPDDWMTVVVAPSRITVRVAKYDGGLYPSGTLYPSPALYPRRGALITEYGVAYASIDPNAFFHSLSLHGAQVVDYLWVFDGEPGTDDYQLVFNEGLEPEWDSKTRLLALFNGGLNAGNTDVNLAGFSHWHVYRENLDDGTLEYAASVPSSVAGIYDYLVSNNATYRYYIYPVGEYGIGWPLVSQEISIGWKEWTLITSKEAFATGNELSPHRVYRFFHNLRAGDISNNNNPNILVGFARFPKVQAPNANYMSGELTTLVALFEAGCDGAQVSSGKDYAKTRGLYNELFGLSTDGRRKFLKDPLGNVFEVCTGAPIAQNILYDVSEDAVDLRLPWVQVGTIEGILMAEALP